MAKAPIKSLGAEDAAEANEAARLERLKNRTFTASTGDEGWDDIEAPEIGGQSEILELEIGEFVQDVEYNGHTSMVLDGREVTVHMGIMSGESYRLPIGAAFLRAVDQARLKVGDHFAMKRMENVVKKAGVGRGQKMAIYAIKVTKRTATVEQE